MINKSGNVHIKVTIRQIRVTNVVVSITYSECVSVALIMQHAMRMRRIAIFDLYSDTLHSVGLLWTGDQPHAEIST